ncbi:hypothetical protein M422DRAFT_29074 [Sphaerobolus stellatus SS14]|uniref:Uncharacterized protein n=1 Tax=Sphaerobolus stellatus (strain SS14) TaxID=990650 RepID=A0A0C9W3Y3_SPHS4|nr:hypothetical protein M422DRAFT_39523 [Sphaerobolus stellatus SS14]KIJ46887.1 hypothetical protein M422DRAFT_29074 [Sphaerobolus stellatus SS14]
MCQLKCQPSIPTSSPVGLTIGDLGSQSCWPFYLSNRNIPTSIILTFRQCYLCEYKRIYTMIRDRCTELDIEVRTSTSKFKTVSSFISTK